MSIRRPTDSIDVEEDLKISNGLEVVSCIREGPNTYIKDENRTLWDSSYTITGGVAVGCRTWGL